jgi:uncharacterized protein
MLFGWDEAKRARNLEKHGVDFVDMIAVLRDPNRLERNDTREGHGENRFQVLGRLHSVCFFVVYTDIDTPPPTTRWIISARLAEPHEEQEFNHRKRRSKWHRVEDPP